MVIIIDSAHLVYKMDCQKLSPAFYCALAMETVGYYVLTAKSNVMM